MTPSLKGVTIFVRREDRACCIFYPSTPSEVEKGVSVIHPVSKYLSRRVNFEKSKSVRFRINIKKNG